MNIFKTLFSSESVVDKTVNGIYDGIDKVVYTAEEKADNRQQLLKLYEPFKIAQRFLALIFGIPYVLAWFVTFIMSFYIDVNAQLALLDGKIGLIVVSIVTFYFGGGMLESKRGK